MVNACRVGLLRVTCLCRWRQLGQTTDFLLDRQMVQCSLNSLTRTAQETPVTAPRQFEYPIR